MSRHTIHPSGKSSGLITERAARRVSAHRRAVTAPAPAGPVTPASSARQSTPSPAPAGGARILRRWSVAELISRAAVGQPVIA